MLRQLDCSAPFPVESQIAINHLTEHSTVDTATMSKIPGPTSSFRTTEVKWVKRVGPPGFGNCLAEMLALELEPSARENRGHGRAVVLLLDRELCQLERDHRSSAQPVNFGSGRATREDLLPCMLNGMELESLRTRRSRCVRGRSQLQSGACPSHHLSASASNHAISTSSRPTGSYHPLNDGEQ
jgi:hypothetical protein